MAEHTNALACIGWDPYPATAICEHNGCPWSSPSTATSEQAQIAAFLTHHTNNHQEGQ